MVFFSAASRLVLPPSFSLGVDGGHAHDGGASNRWMVARSVTLASGKMTAGTNLVQLQLRDGQRAVDHGLSFAECAHLRAARDLASSRSGSNPLSPRRIVSFSRLIPPFKRSRAASQSASKRCASVSARLSRRFHRCLRQTVAFNGSKSG